MSATAGSTRTLARSTAARHHCHDHRRCGLAGGGGQRQASGTVTSVERYRATLGPLQSVGLPDLKCPAESYLHNNYSPGRPVPSGVQVLEPGGVGVSMSGVTLAATQPKGLPLRVQVYDSTAGPASATNWDLSSDELVINLVCTTNPWDAAYYDP